MNDDVTLRDAAREAIRTGRLPSRRPDCTWGGPGAGEPCTICGMVVDRNQPELELEFVRDGDSGSDTYRVHVRCFAVWELELRDDTGGAPSAPAARGSSAAVASNDSHGAKGDGAIDGFLSSAVDLSNSGRRECGRPHKPQAT